MVTFGRKPSEGLERKGYEHRAEDGGTAIANTSLPEEVPVIVVPKQPMGLNRRPRRDGGFTLMEVLIVVAILGMMTLIATMAVSKALKRQRLEVAARQLQSFIEKAYIRTVDTHASVFVVLFPVASDGTRAVDLVEDTNGDLQLSDSDQVLETTLLTSDIVVWTNAWPLIPATFMGKNVTAIACDTMGRAMDPSVSPAQPLNGQFLALTHRDMAGSVPSLTPRIRYDLTMDRLWHCTMSQPTKFTY